MTIYADQMFVENFIMNFIILYMTAKLCSIEWKWYKLSLGATVGALYVILSYAWGYYDKPLVIVKIILSLSIVGISFFPSKLKAFFKELLYFYLITFFIGGVSLGLAYFFNIVTVKEGGILYVEEFPVIMVALGSIIAFALGKYAVIFVKKCMKELIYRVKIKIFDKSLETLVLYDSGHSVLEPFTGHPVVIMEKVVLEGIIPKEVLDNIERNNFDFDEKWKRRLRVIPVSTVSSEKKILTGFKVDEFVIYKKNGDVHIDNAIVVFCNKKLSQNGEFYGLIGK